MWEGLWMTDTFAQILMDIDSSGQAYYDPEKGKYTLKFKGQLATNWLYVGATGASRHCAFWKDICFDRFHHVHSHCKMRCYKVVVRPRTFKETFTLFNLMRAMPYFYGMVGDVFGKCGIDSRPYVHEDWGGFWYTDSLEDGRAKYKIIKQAIKEHMPNAFIDDIHLADTLLLKRSCTEMELAHPDTSTEFWNTMTPDEQEMERRLEDIFAWNGENITVQPDWQRNYTILKWAYFANSHGDLTAEEFLGPSRNMTIKYKTYHLLAPEDNAPCMGEATPAQPNLT